MFSRLFLGLSLLTLVVSCSSKKTTENVDNKANAAPVSDTAVDQTPMSFDAAGSDSGKIDGLSSINFEYDKANLTETAKKTLVANANWMKSRATTNIQIEGHSDNRGTIEYNLALGERRAQTVKNYIVGLGIAANRVSIISYGEEKPLATGDNEAAYAKNRRANFVPLAQ